MDTAQWPLENSDPRHLVNEMGLAVKPSPETMVSSTTTTITWATGPQVMERKPRPQKGQVLSCPRCQSTNTKFCYYNNYSLTQPRYFCKTCRRYWTEGGSLRNVPVGGGSRKNKRSSTSSTITTKTPTPSTAPSSSLSSSATSSRKLPDVLLPPPSSSSFQNPKFHEGQDLNLAFPQQQRNGNLGELHAIESNGNNNTNNVAAGNTSTCSSAASSGSLSATELLQNGLSVKGPSPFMQMITAPEASAVYPSVFGLQDFRSASLSFSVDAIVGGGGYGNVQEVQMGGRRMFFPFEDLRQVPSTPAHEFEHNRGQGADPSGFWSGVMGGDAAGSW